MKHAVALLLSAAVTSGQAAIPKPLENDYVRVVRNAAPCAVASPSVCGARVLVALGPIDIVENFHPRHMERGEIAVFPWVRDLHAAGRRRVR